MIPGLSASGSFVAAVATAAGLVVFTPADTPAAERSERAVTFTAHPIPSFRIGRPDIEVFGRLRWIGGLELEAGTREVGGLSGLLVRDGGRALTAITDDGKVVAATIDRDAGGRPAGLSSARLQVMRSRDPGLLDDENEPDSEGLDVSGDTVAISFETVPRVMTGTLQPDGMIGVLDAVDLPADIGAVRSSKGLEALAFAPAEGALSGRIVVIAERSPRGRPTGDRPGWVLGAEPIQFLIVDDGYDITDAAFGPDGDLYLLERLFTLSGGAGMQIRRISAKDLVDGAAVDGEEITTADLANQIDNMEGMAFWTDENGRTILSLISDDNRSFMQRMVYLEFELLPE